MGTTDNTRDPMKTTHSLLMLLCLIMLAPAAEPDPFTLREPPQIIGRWDLKVRDLGEEYPSWLEFQLSGYRTIVGSYVGRGGSTRPIGLVHFQNGRFRFAVPPQWERRTNDIIFEGRLEGDMLRGTTTNDKGTPIQWEGRRAPSLHRTAPPKWGEPINLCNGRDLTGWKPRITGAKKGWRIGNGVLAIDVPGTDLMTEQLFTDFRLYAEFRYPREGNSGIYLRGRYEIQIVDDFGKDPDSHRTGGIYGFLTPRINAGKKAGEWQTLEATLVGREVTIVLNGEPIIQQQAIPGITGGALDSDEEKPGPLLLQGDHSSVEFRNMTLTPSLN
jgi:hypothetical protein